MTRKPTLNDINRDELAAMYGDKIYVRSIASHFGISTSSVYKLCRKLCLPHRITPKNIDSEKFKRLYFSDMPMLELANEFGISRSHIFKIRDRLGLPRRYQKQKRG